MFGYDLLRDFDFALRYLSEVNPQKSGLLSSEFLPDHFLQPFSTQFVFKKLTIPMGSTVSSIVSTVGIQSGGMITHLIALLVAPLLTPLIDRIRHQPPLPKTTLRN